MCARVRCRGVRAAPVGAAGLAAAVSGGSALAASPVMCEALPARAQPTLNLQHVRVHAPLCARVRVRKTEPARAERASEREASDCVSAGAYAART